MLGCYAEWISSNPEVLNSVLPLLLQGICNNKELLISATLSLRDVIRENQAHIAPFATIILSTVRPVLQTPEVRVRESLRLMECVGFVLSVLPDDVIMLHLNEMLAPHVQTLLRCSQRTEVNTFSSLILSLKSPLPSTLLDAFASFQPISQQVLLEHRATVACTDRKSVV